MKEKKTNALFITILLSLTLNNASTSLGDGCYLRTLMYLRIKYKFYERTCLVFKKKKKTSYHSCETLRPVLTCNGANQFLIVRIELKIRSRTRWAFKNHPTLVVT